MSAEADAKNKATREVKITTRDRDSAQDEIVLRLKTLQQEADAKGQVPGEAMRIQINRVRKMFRLSEIS